MTPQDCVKKVHPERAAKIGSRSAEHALLALTNVNFVLIHTMPNLFDDNTLAAKLQLGLGKISEKVLRSCEKVGEKSGVKSR